MLKSKHLIIPSVIAASFTFWTATAAASTALEKSLAQFHANPPICADAFDFVVIGDNQNYVPTDQPECFKQMLREFANYCLHI